MSKLGRATQYSNLFSSTVCSALILSLLILKPMIWLLCKSHWVGWCCPTEISTVMKIFSAWTTCLTWLSSPGNRTNMMNELNCLFCLICINLNLNSHMWVEAIILDSASPGVRWTDMGSLPLQFSSFSFLLFFPISSFFYLKIFSIHVIK